LGNFRDDHETIHANDSFTPPYVAVRLGAERISGRFGFTPAARVDYAFWGTYYDGSEKPGWHWLHVGADFRLSAHWPRVIPHVSFGLGRDLNFTPGHRGGGLGANIGIGTLARIRSSFALGLNLTYHPGLSSAWDTSNTTYVGFNVEFALY